MSCQSEVERFVRRVEPLEDNGFVRGLLQRGTVRGVREMLVRQGRIKLGIPSPETLAAIEAIGDIDRLGTLSERLLSVDTWDALLAE